MPKTAVPFTVEDLRTPERLERVLGLFNKALEQGHAAAAAPLDLGTLANQLAPMLRDQLQSPGAFPLNLTALLPAIAGAVVTEGTHSDRLTLFTPPSAVGAIFWETDRTVAYVAVNNGGPLVWRFMAGEYVAPFANRPADLGLNDSGFLFYAFDQSSVYVWFGSGWDTITRRILFNGGFFSIFNAVLTATRTYQLPDADSNLTYETIPPVAGNLLAGGGGALIVDSGSPAPPVPSTGTYTPVLTNVANLTSSSPQVCQWGRIGGVGGLVTVSGYLLAAATVAAVQTQLRITLPVNSNFSAAEQCGGVAFCGQVAGFGAAIQADAPNSCLLQYVAADISNRALFFILAYRVI